MTLSPDACLTALKYAAFDLDGTLIDEAGQPYAGVVEGLAGLRGRGLVPLVITGRSVRSFRNLRHLDELVAQLDHEILFSEGNVLLDRRTDRLSFPLTCPPGTVRELTGVPGIDLVAEGAGEFLATTARAAVQFAMAYRLPRSQIAVDGPGLAAMTRPTAVTVFRSAGSAPLPPPSAGCEAVTIGPFGATVIRPRGTGKAAGLRRHLRSRFGEHDLSRTLAIGDGATDAPMLSACAAGIATSNADQVAAAAATWRLRAGLGDFLRTLDTSLFHRIADQQGLDGAPERGGSGEGALGQEVVGDRHVERLLQIQEQADGRQ